MKATVDEAVGGGLAVCCDERGFQSETGYAAAQTDFLELLSLDGKGAWTRAVAFYDLLPKFVFTTDSRARLGGMVVRENEVEIRGSRFRVTLMPGKVIRRREGAVVSTIERWPGEREELICRVLRYLAVQGKVPVSVWERPREKASQIRIAFSFHQLISVLAEWGHTMNSVEVDEGLQVLLSARLEVATVDDGNRSKSQRLYSGHIITEYYGVRDADGSQRRVVVLNGLEAEAIRDGTHQVLNFYRLMSLSSPRTRRIYELVMIRWRNAAPPPNDASEPAPPPYRLRLSDLITQGIVDPAKALRKTAALVRESLGELAHKGVLWAERPYREMTVKVPTKGRARILDWTWEIWLSRESVADLIAALKEEATGQDKVLLQLPPSRRRELRARAKAALP